MFTVATKSERSVPHVTEIDPASTQGEEPLARAVAASNAHRALLETEFQRLEQRDAAIVRAIRAGARLEEVAEAASISRAAISKAARRTLPGRSGRGGPYARRRGSAAALAGVAEAAHLLALARAHAREAKRQRDFEIATVVAQGARVTETARAVGMTPASVSVIARSEGGPTGPPASQAAQLHR
jgi:DNA-binding NarL/FixJ family response regulator